MLLTVDNERGIIRGRLGIPARRRDMIAARK